MSEPPEFYKRAKQQFPTVFESYEELSNAARNAGPLDTKTAAIAKLALSIGTGLEGASHSAVRKALAAGCTPEELHHVVMLGVTTLGFPAAMRARAWVDDVVSK